MRLDVSTLVALVALATSPAAFGQARPRENLELNRQAIETQRRFIISGSLPLTEEEARRFWPLYDAYQEELVPLSRRSADLLAEFVARYPDLQDTHAERLLAEALDIEKRRVDLKRRYLGRMKKALPHRKLVTYFQLENKLDAIVDFDLAQSVPLLR